MEHRKPLTRFFVYFLHKKAKRERVLLWWKPLGSKVPNFWTLGWANTRLNTGGFLFRESDVLQKKKSLQDFLFSHTLVFVLNEKLKKIFSLTAVKRRKIFIPDEIHQRDDTGTPPRRTHYRGVCTMFSCQCIDARIHKRSKASWQPAPGVLWHSVMDVNIACAEHHEVWRWWWSCVCVKFWCCVGMKVWVWGKKRFHFHKRIALSGAAPYWIGL